MRCKLAMVDGIDGRVAAPAASAPAVEQTTKTEDSWFWWKTADSDQDQGIAGSKSENIASTNPAQASSWLPSWMAPAAAPDPGVPDLSLGASSVFHKSSHIDVGDRSRANSARSGSASARSGASSARSYLAPTVSSMRGPPAQNLNSPFASARGQPGEFMSRADYGRIRHMGETVRQADEVRKERVQRLAFQQKQKEKVRQRGAMLREQRFQTEESIAEAIGELRENAQHIGNDHREQTEVLRYKRVVQDREYRSHGRALTQKYSTKDNQERVRSLKQEVIDEKTRAAIEMKQFLKQAKKDTDDTIMEVNTDRARRVYQDTAHYVIRFSKQQIVAGRWDSADGVREHVAKWKLQKAANEEEYVERARQLATHRSEDATIAAAKRHEERVAYARQQTQWRKDIKAAREIVASSVRERNRHVHDTIEESHLISEDEVVEAAGGKENLSLFARFFDFRKKQPFLSESPRPNPSPRRNVLAAEDKKSNRSGVGVSAAVRI